MGGDSSKGKKCKKLQKAEEQRQLNEKPTVLITIEPVAGPSGLNKPKYPSKPTAAHSLSYASKYNIQDSDDDYDSDEHDFNVTAKKVIVPTALFSEPISSVKSDALAAPDLQLDCFSDDDDDVIFVEENKNVPIDLTNSDSDDDAQIISPPIDTVSIDEGNGSNSNDSMAVNGPDHSTFYNTIGNLFNYDDRMYRPSRYIGDLQPVSKASNQITASNHPQTNPNVSSVAISSIRTHNSVTITTAPSSAGNPCNLVINVPTPPAVQPTPRTNPREMITGDDVMLYEGQNYVPRFMRHDNNNTSRPEPESQLPSSNSPESFEVGGTQYYVVPEPAAYETIENTSNRRHRQYIDNNPEPAPSSNHHSHSNIRHRQWSQAPQPSQHPLAKVMFARSHNLVPTQPPQPPPQVTAPQPPHVPGRQCSGRCPFLTEGHHYNRPRRFTNYISNGRPPYAVHENLWHRQQYQQELRRLYLSPSYADLAEAPPLQPPVNYPPTQPIPGPFFQRAPTAHNYSSNSHGVETLSSSFINGSTNNESNNNTVQHMGPIDSNGVSRYEHRQRAPSDAFLRTARYRRASPASL